jgi:hypothetical protein
MKKSILLLLFTAILFQGTINAQTGVRFGLKAGYNLATQYGITPADNTYIVETGSRNGFAGGASCIFQ